MGRSKQTRMGVVGYGEWGPNHVRNFSSLPDAKVVGIADFRPERLKARPPQFQGIRTFQSHKQLMEAVRLDSLIVARAPLMRISSGTHCRPASTSFVRSPSV